LSSTKKEMKEKKRKDDIRQRVYDIDLVVAEIQKMPQTYNSLLQHCSTDGTCQILIRKKIGRLIEDGTVCRTAIPGTRFGKALFYVLPKKYHILVESGRTGSEVFCFFAYKRLDAFRINVVECYRLDGSEWKKIDGPRGFFEGNVLMWI
jgi:hypothetical protein